MGTPIETKEKIRWVTVHLPHKVIERIKRVIVFSGCPSVAETMNPAMQ